MFYIVKMTHSYSNNTKRSSADTAQIDAICCFHSQSALCTICTGKTGQMSKEPHSSLLISHTSL